MNKVSDKKTTILDVLDVIDNQMEYLTWGVIVFLIAVVIIAFNNNNNNKEIALSNNQVISKLIDAGYNPVVAGCAINPEPIACTIVASKINLNQIKSGIK